jgi:hypothetical protein
MRVGGMVMMYAVLFALGCGQNNAMTSSSKDIALVNIESPGRNFVAYTKLGDGSVHLSKCKADSPLPLNRNCQADATYQIGLDDFKDSIAMPTGGFPRTDSGFQLAGMALERAKASNRPEEEIKKISWHYYNIEAILSTVSLLSAEQNLTAFSNEAIYKDTVDAVIRFHKDSTSGRRYRYIANASSWDDNYLCSQLGGNSWKPLEITGQVDKRILVDIFNGSIGVDMPTIKVGDRIMKAISFDDSCETYRSVIAVEASKIGKVKDSDIVVDSYTSSSESICDMELPTLCVSVP